MKLSVFLEEVNKIYIPGLVRFYGNMKPDPWQAAHDKLEAALITKDEIIISATIRSVFTELKRLADAYKAGMQSPVPAEPWEAFHKPEIADHFENKIKACRVCGERQNLTSISTGPKASDMQIVCQKHRPQQ